MVARGATGATTVSATMLLAHRAVRFPSRHSRAMPATQATAASRALPLALVLLVLLVPLLIRSAGAPALLRLCSTLCSGSAPRCALRAILRGPPPMPSLASLHAPLPPSPSVSPQGISIFVTGGIGGVHRGGEFSWDVSADLTELGRTPVAVVCAGVKSILDIPRTLEVLETQGVTVVTLGSDIFPAFYSRDSGVPTPARVDSPAQAALSVHAAQRLGLGGSLIAVPIPAEAEADGSAVEAATAAALREADECCVVGAAVTPFILKRVAELTAGASLDANIALVKHNAAVGAAVARELARIIQTARGGGGGSAAAVVARGNNDRRSRIDENR